jgi:1-acyl-sn-glycerol-3-phosphate acyltransferase
MEVALMPPILRLFKPLIDFLLTLILWVYFTLGYIFFFIPIIILAYPFIHDRELLFQKMNHNFYRVFFLCLGAITPGLSIKISSEVKKIRSSVVISNHRSYLDPILLISLFPMHKTIVKGIFFKMPVLSWVMKSGGYIPYSPDGEYNNFMEMNITNIARFMERGGNLFIFPEGRRSRDGSLGNFQKGSFSIARRYKAPVQMIFIHGTERLFKPGNFFFNTCVENIISVEKLGSIEPGPMTAREMRERAVRLYAERMKHDINK